MTDFMNGDNTGKASPSSTGNSAKASPGSELPGIAADGHSDFMNGTHSGSAKPSSMGMNRGGNNGKHKSEGVNRN